MSEEQLQFAISQYVDGTLPPAEAAALEKRLREDPAARRILDEYRRIGDLVQVALPEPEMDWDRLTTRISAAIDRNPVTLPEEAPATFRIGFWRPLALAAAVLLCASVAFVLLREKTEPAPAPVAAVVPTPAPAPVVPTPPAPVPEPVIAVAQINVLTAAKPAGAPVLSVQVGPAANHNIDWANLYPETISGFRSSVSIAADPVPANANDELGVVQ